MIMKKLLSVTLSIFIILTSFSYVLGADIKTKLNIIQKSSETEYLENDQGYISKTIVDSNEDTGEVTVELKVSNTSKDTEINKNTEIFLVLDNSKSMDYNATETETRKSVIASAATNLVNNIYNNNSNVKIGIVRFASKINGKASGSDKEYYQPNAANLMNELTSDKTYILNTISEYSAMETEAGTNIYAGLKKAYENFSSENTNKIIILLTDGLPTEYTESYYDYASQTSVDSNTKNYIEQIGNRVTLISLMTGIIENSDEEEDSNRVEEIFGTNENPTAGYFYNISDADIDSIVNNDIFQNVMDIIQNPINNVTIVDYFPKDITDNFEFSYVENLNIGTVSDEINTENNTIEWDIGTLRGDEVATLRYKLKIKNMNNEELLNKTITTNERVVLTYEDNEERAYTVTLSSSPRIQLSEVTEEPNINTSDNDDDTTAPGNLPQTGIGISVGIGIIVLIIGIIIVYSKYTKLKDIK